MLLLLLAALTQTPAAPPIAQRPLPRSEQMLDSTLLAGFRWRNIGPANMGGRVSSVAGIPSPSRTFFVAAAAGGIWKTTNAGTTFRPVFDNYPCVSMGELAIAPSDTMQVWAGTGEEDSRNTISPGCGMFKSTDGGLTWKRVGLEKSGAIGRIVVHPTNPNIVYVAALGQPWSANPERGLYKTTDGGKTWTEVKAGGLPTTTRGRIGIAIAASDPKVIYLMFEADTNANAQGGPGKAAQTRPSGLYRSADGGATWEKMNGNDVRPFYYSQVRVDPKDPNRVYWSSTPV